MATSQRSKRTSQSSAAGATCSSAKDSVARSEVRALAHIYAIRAREEARAPDIIAGTFYLSNVIVYALIDPGSTHSYICTVLASEKKLSVEPTEYDVQFDVILGMDWLTKHDAVINCCEKQISLKCQTGDILSVEPENSNDVIKIISAFLAQRLMRKGNEEVEFVIDVVPGTAPILVTPYRMAPAELKELKT
ncbi:uncharacterized protein LOC108462036 [Gossypium arboreum]|uniref:uncharacterized protein LOC108462036 n=1 Tax=Gossypium arboreum TaxID=29729 RepID=UPI00081946DA|nr:uncharacterized protein LOC108462036 [Gossypium arboreum]